MTDKKFIEVETGRMLSEGIIRRSNSPWSAQVLVTTGGSHKKRMAIDYSQTINRVTELGAYPLLNIDEMVNSIARYKVFSTLDLRNVYHQVAIREEERPYTAFEAGGKLYEFNRIPFGVKNGVAAFQHVLDELLSNEKLNGTFVYVDSVTLCGESEEEHDQNLTRFLKVAEEYNLTLYCSKCDFKVRAINLLGYSVKDGEIKPDPEHFQPPWNLPPSKDIAFLCRAIGLLAHYSRWIPNFSEKIRPLAHVNGFPLSTEALQAFENLKEDISNAVVLGVDPSSPFTVETDASDHTIAATLTQNSHPVAFFSCTLSQSERGHSSAYAIVEALRKWKQNLVGLHF